jgi:hypothetical protein
LHFAVAFCGDVVLLAIGVDGTVLADVVGAGAGAGTGTDVVSSPAYQV